MKIKYSFDQVLLCATVFVHLIQMLLPLRLYRSLHIAKALAKSKINNANQEKSMITDTLISLRNHNNRHLLRSPFLPLSEIQTINRANLPSSSSNLNARTLFHSCFSKNISKITFFPENNHKISTRLSIIRAFGNSENEHRMCNETDEIQIRRRIPPVRSVSEESSQFESIKEEKFFTIPTILTLARVAAIPILLSVFYLSPELSTVVFILASLTDWLDGYLARKMGTITMFGAFLDPVADKLMVAAVLVLLCTEPPLPSFPSWAIPIPSIAIIGREITMSAVREWAASQKGDLHKAVAVSSLGKWKTACQMVALSLLLICRHKSLQGPDIELAVLGSVGLLYVAAALGLWSLALYMRAIWPYLIGKRI